MLQQSVSKFSKFFQIPRPDDQSSRNDKSLGFLFQFKFSDIYLGRLESFGSNSDTVRVRTRDTINPIRTSTSSNDYRNCLI